MYPPVAVLLLNLEIISIAVLVQFSVQYPQASQVQKKYHNRNTNPSNLQVGEKVYLLRPAPQVGLTPKLQPKYKGPFILTLILGKDGLVGPVLPGRRKPTWVHLNHIKRVIPRAVPEYDWTQEEIPLPESATKADAFPGLDDN